jgi:hypothetical protein
MGITTVNSPNNSSGNTGRTANRPIGTSPWSSSRSDGGHIAGHVGKNAATNPKLRFDDGDNVFRTPAPPGSVRRPF